MPITYARDDVRRRIIVTVVAMLSVEELLGIVDRQANEQTWTYALLYDARLVTKAQAGTPDEVRRVLQHVATLATIHGPRGPVAIVTDHPANYAIVRLYSTFRAQANVTVDVFRDWSSQDSMDLEMEVADAGNYAARAKQAEALGDCELRLKLEEMAADEAGHAREFRRLLKGSLAQDAVRVPVEEAVGSR